MGGRWCNRPLTIQVRKTMLECSPSIPIGCNSSKSYTASIPIITNDVLRRARSHTNVIAYLSQDIRMIF